VVFPVAEELVRRGVRVIFITGYQDGYHFPRQFEGFARLLKPYPEHQLKRLMVATFGRT
jgi:hypothetical protein